MGHTQAHRARTHRQDAHRGAGGAPEQLDVESLWPQFTSECQRFWHPLRLNKYPF
jgi:hypothetical protein